VQNFHYDWVQSTWFPLLGYTPEVIFMTRGWFGFRFKSTEDTLIVLDKFWVIDGCSLMLKHWRVSFDPVQDYFQFHHLWVLLPGLSNAFLEREGSGGHRQCARSLH
jgi:hypothetical protein